MATFVVKSRRTSPTLTASIDATSREEAVDKVAKSCPEGETVDILEVEELPDGVAPPKAAKETKTETHKEK
jgi:hypothetical protein